MQTSVIVYGSQNDDAETMLPQLPDGSKIAKSFEDIEHNKLCIIITHDQESAKKANKWIEKQPEYRQKQILLILPNEKSKINPNCIYKNRPIHINDILLFISSTKALPNIPNTVKLTEIETNIIELLYSAQEPVSHQNIMKKVWGHSKELDTHTLETHLYRLRKKIENTKLNVITEDGSYNLLSSD